HEATFRSMVTFWSSMPASMAATNGRACTGVSTSDATAGPGHRPAMPQPMPNRAAPAIRRGSRSVRSGRANLSPNTGFVMRAWMRQAAAMTRTAPPMTKASVGSQLPNRSRKPRTRCGSVMPDTVRPIPKRNPEATGGRSLRVRDMSGSDKRHNEDGSDAGRHEGGGRHDRALRQPADAAHAVAACAAAAHPGAEADQEAGSDQQGPAGEHRRLPVGSETDRQRPEREADDEAPGARSRHASFGDASAAGENT